MAEDARYARGGEPMVTLSDLADCRSIVAHSRPSSMDSSDITTAVHGLLRAVEAAYVAVLVSACDGDICTDGRCGATDTCARLLALDALEPFTASRSDAAAARPVPDVAEPPEEAQSANNAASAPDGAIPRCPECGHELYGYRGPLCRYCAGEAE